MDMSIAPSWPWDPPCAVGRMARAIRPETPATVCCGGNRARLQPRAPGGRATAGAPVGLRRPSVPSNFFLQAGGELLHPLRGAPDDRGAVPHHEVLEVETRELLDRLPVLLRVHVVPVVHGPEPALVVHRVPRDQEGAGRVEEGNAPRRVTRREDYPQAVLDLAVLEEDVHRRPGVRLSCGPRRARVCLLLRDEVRLDP